jgi:cell division protein ZapE
VLYDHRVKLVASTAVAAEEIYTDGVQASEFGRTVSRLTEMQTEEYLAQAHLPGEFHLAVPGQGKSL